MPEFTCQVAGCCQVFEVLEDYEHHYHTLHRNVCSFCKRAFPSGHLLDIHILEWHDSLFQILSERQDMVGGAISPAGSHQSCLPSCQSSQLSGLWARPGDSFRPPAPCLSRWGGGLRVGMEVTPFLFQYQCLVEGCAEKFKTSKDRKDHLVRRHLYPADFRFDKPKKSRGYVRRCDAHTAECGYP